MLEGGAGPSTCVWLFKLRSLSFYHVELGLLSNVLWRQVHFFQNESCD